MLQAGYAGKLAPAAADYVGAICESVERLSKLIDDVLDLTEGDTRGVVLERERVDIAGLCRAAAEALRPRAEEKGQALVVTVDPSAGTVMGDSRRLRESLEHLLRNGVAYSDDNGRIEIIASGDDDNAFITVADNGPGISEDDQAMVFSRFHRVIGAARGDAALGLGLPLTRQFIEAHGGHVSLESAPGEGTSVTLSIPRAKP
jgi:signal transduction histidine kinase